MPWMAWLGVSSPAWTVQVRACGVSPVAAATPAGMQNETTARRLTTVAALRMRISHPVQLGRASSLAAILVTIHPPVAVVNGQQSEARVRSGRAVRIPRHISSARPWKPLVSAT
jgi:hypothetical protein